MGTRNSLIIIQDEKIKVAKYCQWDGYPLGQGSSIIQFLREMPIDDTFRNNINSIKQLSDKDVREKWKQLGADDSGFVSIELSEQFKELYPQLSRDFGGGHILQLYRTGSITYEKYSLGNYSEITITPQNPFETFIDLEWAKDGFDCEWCHVIDLDKNIYTIYEGNYLGKVYIEIPFDKIPSDEEFETYHEEYYKNNEE